MSFYKALYLEMKHGRDEMKRKTIWITVGVVSVVVLVAIAARASLRNGNGWCGHGHWHRGGPLSYLSHQLKLSDAQISQVHAIWNEERPAVAGILNNMVDGAHQMSAATVDGRQDEGKVQSIAAAEGNNFAKLLMEKERIKSRIYTTVLSEEQKQTADKLQQRGLSRLDHVVSRLNEHRD